MIAQVSAQANTTAIDITEFSFTPSTVDVSNSSQTVTVTIRVTDTERDVSDITVSFRSPRGHRFNVDLSSQDRISGNARDGVYRKTDIFRQYSEAGTWKIDYISVYDGRDRRFFSNLTPKELK